MAVEIITRVDYEKLSGASKTKVFILYFFASWCGPCQMMAPIYDKIAIESKDIAELRKVDVEASKEWAQELGVSSIPTIIAFKDGKEINRNIGYADEITLANFVKSSK